jgi:ParB-like chromosome segregation protein Spo0J
MDQLRESPTNPRRRFDQDKLQELAQNTWFR